MIRPLTCPECKQTLDVPYYTIALCVNTNQKLICRTLCCQKMVTLVPYTAYTVKRTIQKK